MGDASHIGRVTAAGLAMAPAPAVLGAVVFLLCTAVPRRALFAWAAMVLSSAMGLLAAALDLPMWARDLSPSQHVPAMPAADFAFAPLVLLTLVAAVFVAAGFAALAHRGIGAGVTPSRLHPTVRAGSGEAPGSGAVAGR